MRKFLMAAAAGGLALIAADPALAARRALLVGVGAYPSGKLYGPPNDLALMTTVLRKMGYRPEDVKTLKDGEATLEGINAAFRSWLIDGTAPGDEVVFYFSGHGSQIPDESGDEKEDGLDEVLLPYDWRQADGKGRFLVDDDLEKLLDQLQGRRVSVFIDACHSGTATRSLGELDAQSRFMDVSGGAPAIRPQAEAGAPAAKTDGPKPPRQNAASFVPANPWREVWSASASSEKAFEMRIGGEIRGVFTNALSQAILRQVGAGGEVRNADADGDGIVSRQEALEHVQFLSKTTCREALPNLCYDTQRSLTPQLEASPKILQLEIGVWPPAETPPEAPPPPPERPAAGWLAAAFGGGGQPPALLRLVDEEDAASAPEPEGPMKFKVSSPIAGSLILAQERPNGEILHLFPLSARPEQNALFTEANKAQGLIVPDLYAGLGYKFDPDSRYFALIVPEGAAAAMRAFADQTQRGPAYVEALQEALRASASAPAALAVGETPR